MNEHIPSTLFDVFCWPNHKELEAIYERLWQKLPKTGQHKTVEGLKRHLRQILCNLYVSHYYEKPIAISLKKDMFARGRYKKLHIKYRVLKRIFDFLQEEGLISCKKGIKPYSETFEINWEKGESKYYPKHKKGCVTRMWPSDTLRIELAKLGNLQILKETDCIIMREKIDEVKYDIPFTETPLTENISKDISLINGTLTNHYLEYNLNIKSDKSDNPFFINLNKEHNIHHEERPEETYPTSLLRGTNCDFRRFSPQIRAVFSNGSFEHGGRLYASVQKGMGNWQSMPQIQRKTILIDNRPTVELDFDAFHISMLYAVEGLQLAPKPYDSYATVAPKVMRPIVKKLLLAVLNADSEKSAVKAMDKEVRKLKNKKCLSARNMTLLKAIDECNPDWMDLIERLREAHAPIAHYFCSGAGVMLQRLDSEIMRRTLVYLAEQDIPALPVHDSAIVAAHHESELHIGMSMAYGSVFGYDFECGISKK